MDTLSLSALIERIVTNHAEWQNGWYPYVPDPALSLGAEEWASALTEFHARLADNYPFFHPSYAGQMLKPPHAAAVIGYLAAMLVNPNNHALDGGPATGAMEKEATAMLARMFGYEEFLGHLTSSGTIANLEALWVARQLHPEAAIAFSDQAHYTHRRMCEVLQIRSIEIPTHGNGTMDLEALQSLCLSENIGTVVATVGTTGLGALDRLDALTELAREHGFRIHADAAYGGFYRVLAPTGAVDSAVYEAMSACDSIVVDPHKHGLQPYGCGCVLFKDPSVGRFYKHDSPYTYFTSDDLHLGEISLECSRPGAAAAALWLTLRLFPLEAGRGFGPILRACRNAALGWANLIRTSEELYLVLEPELDIVVYFPQPKAFSARAISDASNAVFTALMNDPSEPVYLSKFRMRTAALREHYPDILADDDWTVVLRSVLMKPEHHSYVERIHARVCEAVRAFDSGDTVLETLALDEQPEEFDEG